MSDALHFILKKSLPDEKDIDLVKHKIVQNNAADPNGCLNGIFANVLSNHVNQYANRNCPQIYINIKLTTRQQSLLCDTFSNFKLIFRDESPHSHGFAAALKICMYHHILKIENYTSTKTTPHNYFMKDVGGKFGEHFDHGNVHSCNPVLDNKDAARIVSNNNRLARKSQNNPSGTFPSVCGNKANFCSVTAYMLLFDHSLYDIKPQEIADALYIANAKIAYATMIFVPNILIYPTGEITPLNCRWRKYKIDNELMISFTFGDGSLDYVHNWETYLLNVALIYFTTTDGKARYVRETIGSYHGMVMFKFTRCYSDEIQTSTVTWSLPEPHVVITTLWHFSNVRYGFGDAIKEKIDSDLSSLKKVQVLCPRKLWNELICEISAFGDNNFTLKKVQDKLRVKVTQIVVNGTVVSNPCIELREDAEKFKIIAVAAYLHAYKVRYEQTQTVKKHANVIAQGRRKRLFDVRQLLVNICLNPHDPPEIKEEGDINFDYAPKIEDYELRLTQTVNPITSFPFAIDEFVDKGFVFELGSAKSDNVSIYSSDSTTTRVNVPSDGMCGYNALAKLAGISQTSDDMLALCVAHKPDLENATGEARWADTETLSKVAKDLRFNYVIKSVLDNNTPYVADPDSREFLVPGYLLHTGCHFDYELRTGKGIYEAKLAEGTCDKIVVIQKPDISKERKKELLYAAIVEIFSAFDLLAPIYLEPRSIKYFGFKTNLSPCLPVIETNKICDLMGLLMISDAMSGSVNTVKKALAENLSKLSLNGNLVIHLCCATYAEISFLIELSVNNFDKVSLCFTKPDVFTGEGIYIIARRFRGNFNAYSLQGNSTVDYSRSIYDLNVKFKAARIQLKEKDYVLKKLIDYSDITNRGYELPEVIEPMIVSDNKFPSLFSKETYVELDVKPPQEIPVDRYPTTLLEDLLEHFPKDLVRSDRAVISFEDYLKRPFTSKAEVRINVMRNRKIDHAVSAVSIGKGYFDVTIDPNVKESKWFDILDEFVVNAFVNRYPGRILHDSIVKATTEYIVNAANANLKKGGGVCGAIYEAAGPELERETDRIVSERGAVKTCENVTTGAGNLSFKGIVHAVAPINKEIDFKDPELLQTYANLITIPGSYTVPLLGAGIYRHPLEYSAHCAVSTWKEGNMIATGGFLPNAIAVVNAFYSKLIPIPNSRVMEIQNLRTKYIGKKVEKKPDHMESKYKKLLSFTSSKKVFNLGCAPGHFMKYPVHHDVEHIHFTIGDLAIEGDKQDRVTKYKDVNAFAAARKDEDVDWISDIAVAGTSSAVNQYEHNKKVIDNLHNCWLNSNSKILVCKSFVDATSIDLDCLRHVELVDPNHPSAEAVFVFEKDVKTSVDIATVQDAAISALRKFTGGGAVDDDNISCVDSQSFHTVSDESSVKSKNSKIPVGTVLDELPVRPKSRIPVSKRNIRKSLTKLSKKFCAASKRKIEKCVNNITLDCGDPADWLQIHTPCGSSKTRLPKSDPNFKYNIVQHPDCVVPNVVLPCTIDDFMMFKNDNGSVSHFSIISDNSAVTTYAPVVPISSLDPELKFRPKRGKNDLENAAYEQVAIWKYNTDVARQDLLEFARQYVASADINTGANHNRYKSYYVIEDGKVICGTNANIVDGKPAYMTGMLMSGEFVRLNNKENHKGKIFVNHICEVFPDPFLYERFKDVEFSFDAPDVSLVQGVPGCGKTTYILEQLKNRKNVLALTVTNSGSKDLIERDSSSGNKIGTVDSYLLNQNSLHDLVYIDEYLMKHHGALVIVMYVSKCKEMYMLGDQNQIPYIERQMELAPALKYARLNFPVSTTLVNSYRCPQDVARALRKDYLEIDSDFVSKSDVASSMSVHKIDGLDSYAWDGVSQILTFTQSEKSLISKKFPHSKVKTIHEFQGQQSDSVHVVRTNPSNGVFVYSSRPHIIVAMTRHKRVLHYYTVSLQDPLADKIRKAVPLTGGGVRVYDLSKNSNGLFKNGLKFFTTSYFCEDVCSDDKFIDLANRFPYDSGENLRVGFDVVEEFDEIEETYDNENSGHLDTLQDCVDTMFGPSAHSRPIDGEDIETCDLSIPVLDGRYNFDRNIKEYKFSKLQPMLISPAYYPRERTPLETIMSTVKRNCNVPELTGGFRAPILPIAMKENFVLKYLNTSASRPFPKIFISPATMKEWATSQDPKVIEQLVKSENILQDVKMNQYDFSIKPQPKPKCEIDAAYVVPALQTIAASPKLLNALFCPIAQIVTERLMSHLKKKILINTRKSIQDFAKEFGEIVSPNDIKHLSSLEIDISKYDKSQGILALDFEIEIMRHFGVPEELLELWRLSHTNTELFDKKNQIKMRVSYQRKSGDAFTLLGNTMLTMACIAMVYDIDQCEAAVFIGDDSLLLARHTFVKWDSVFAKMFNFEVKSFSFKSYFFCSKYLIPTSTGWEFVPDPIKIVIKLGRRDLVNYHHAEEARKSMYDLTSSYDNIEIYELLTSAVAERLSNTYDMSVLLPCIRWFLQSEANFKTLFALSDDMCVKVGEGVAFYSDVDLNSYFSCRPGVEIVEITHPKFIDKDRSVIYKCVEKFNHPDVLYISVGKTSHRIGTDVVVSSDDFKFLDDVFGIEIVLPLCDDPSLPSLDS